MNFYELTNYIKEDNEVWDNFKHKFTNKPEELVDFLCDINEVFLKHNLSISHEDGHGAFIIERYNDSNVRWLTNAQKNYE